MTHRADEDRPFTFSFDTVDLCTKNEHHLVKPNPYDNTITTKLRFELDSACSTLDDRLVMVVGTVTDRFGASAQLCDRELQCPLVSLSEMPDLNPAGIIDDVIAHFQKNRMSIFEAVAELQHAVQASWEQPKKLKPTDLDRLLPILEIAADENLAVSTPQTPQLQGKRHLEV